MEDNDYLIIMIGCDIPNIGRRCQFINDNAMTVVELKI